MFSRLKAVKESVMWQMACQPPFLTYLFGYFIHFNNVTVTDVEVTKVRCYWPIFYFILFNVVWPGVIKPTLFN